jgi:Winged helix-turn helix
MLDALREHLLEKPGLYQDEMAIFLYDEFGVLVTIPNISRALKSIGWTKKATRHVAGEQSAELRDYYLHNLSEFRSYHLVYGCLFCAECRRMQLHGTIYRSGTFIADWHV